MDEIPDISSRRGPELLAIDDALNTLAGFHEQTVLSDWRLARIWLMREIGGR